MKQIGRWMLAGMSVVLAGAAVDGVWAQAMHKSTAGTRSTSAAAGAGAGAGAEKASNKKDLIIRHMPKVGHSTLQRTPDYQSSIGKSVRKPREWALMDVQYETMPEWMDEIVFTYHVLAEHRNVDGKLEYSFYQTVVRYVDVAHGEHSSCVALSPNAVLRYGVPVALTVEISAADGTALASESAFEGKAIPPDLQADWWKNPKVTDNAGVTKRDGYLTDRSKTPFAFINADDYEAVK